MQAVEVFDIKMQRFAYSHLVVWRGIIEAQGSERLSLYIGRKGRGKLLFFNLEATCSFLMCILNFKFLKRCKKLRELSKDEKSTLSGSADVTEWFTQKLSSIGIKKSETDNIFCRN